MSELPSTRILRKSSFHMPPTSQKITRSCSLRRKAELPIEPKSSKNEKVYDTTKDIKDLEKSFQDKVSLKCVAEKYFYQSSEKSKVVSSKKTLAHLGNNRLTTDQATELLLKLPKLVCSKEIENRLKEIEETFPRLVTQLKNGFNIIIHGVGSKHGLLELFASKYLKGTNCVVVPGFKDNLTMTQVLNLIIDSFSIKVQSGSKSLCFLASSIRDFYNTQTISNEELFLIFHNIDGPVFANSLETVSILCQSQNIHVLASVDHINSDRLWPQNSPKWLWYDWTTFLPYNCETMARNSRLMAANSGTGLDSLRAVTASLHDNAKQIFLLLAKYQMMERPGQKYEGMLVETLLRKSRDSFFVANELALRNLLMEFKDHKLIQFKIGQDRSEYIKITLDSDSIQEFVNNFSDF